MTEPAVWGAVLLAAATPGWASDRGFDFAPFLLAIVGGWLVGVSVVNAAFRLRSPLASTLVLTACAAAGVDLALVPLPPGPMVQIAAIPATCWIAFGVLYRLLAAAESLMKRVGRGDRDAKGGPTRSRMDPPRRGRPVDR